MKIDCLKSTKDLVDSLIIFPSNLLIVILNWLCTEIYIIILLLLFPKFQIRFGLIINIQLPATV